MALEELAEFFEVDEHGASANYTPSGGSASAIIVIFRHDYYLEDVGNVGVETQQAVITVQTSKVPGIAHGDLIEIDSINYNVVGVHPDGTGISEIVLEAQ
tara:strand:+ start:454 stop:753 length:300 start_codon:yes stop_codon:yes gene_type:complete